MHLGVSPNQYGNNIQTLGDTWTLIDMDSEDCRCDQCLSECAEAIGFPQQRI